MTPAPQVAEAVATVTWPALYAMFGFLLTVVGGVTAIVLWLWNKFATQEKALAEFKLEVVRDYVEVKTLDKFTVRFESALDGLTQRFERGFQSVLDKLLEQKQQ